MPINHDAFLDQSLRYLHRLTTPGELPPLLVLIVGIVAMVAVFILDLITPAEIRLHVLYIFPLAAIALHCDGKNAVRGAFALSVLCQLYNGFEDNARRRVMQWLDCSAKTGSEPEISRSNHHWDRQCCD